MLGNSPKMQQVFDAIRIAERIRSNIAALSIIAPGAVGGEHVHVTVSIGVAALDSGADRTYSQLMSAADAALYRAKGGGRDQVQMISTTRGLSAVSGASRPLNGAVRDGQATAEPSVFRSEAVILTRSPATSRDCSEALPATTAIGSRAGLPRGPSG